MQTIKHEHGTVTVYHNLDKLPESPKSPVIFLAGPRDEQDEKPWREQAVQHILAHEGMKDFIVIMPNMEGHKPWPVDRAEESTQWQFNAINMALKYGSLMFWCPFTVENSGPTTRTEFGIYHAAREENCFYGRPENAYYVSYLDAVWSQVWPWRDIETDLKNLCIEAISRAYAIYSRRTSFGCKSPEAYEDHAADTRLS